MPHLATLAFGLSESEAEFTHRGFRADNLETRHHLEEIGRTFIRGYNAALDEWGRAAFMRRIMNSPIELRGFAFEGAAMALTLMDVLMPWQRSRLDAFLTDYGSLHVYMIHVGAGWAYARLRRRIERPLGRLHTLLRWLLADGYGFHEGYFHSRHYIVKHQMSSRMSGYALRAFDQGLGRSLWFGCGANSLRIAQAITSFDASRQGDLWSGVGLACTYAGGVAEHTIDTLRALSGAAYPQLAQGAAFAAKTRQLAGNTTPHTERACEGFCGMSSAEAARICDDELVDLPVDLPEDGPEPAYEVWRQRIQARVASTGLTSCSRTA